MDTKTRLAPGQKRYAEGDKVPVAFRLKDGSCTIERRGADVDGKKYHSRIWSVRLTREQKMHIIPLSYDIEEAVTKAKQLKAAFSSGIPIQTIFDSFAPQKLETTIAAVKKEALGYALIGEILTVYKANATLLEVKSYANYVQRFYNLVQRALEHRHGKEFTREQIDKMEASILDGALIRDAKLAFDDDAEDETDIPARRRSFNSALTNARGPFSKNAMKAHKIYAGLQMPDLTDFMEAPAWKESTLTQVYQLPETPIVATVMKGIPSLKKGDMNAYRAALMAAFFGFRAKDIRFARWKWFREADGKATVTFQHDIGPDGTYGQKSKRAEVIEIDVTILHELRATVSGKIDPDAYVIEGELVERREKMFGRLNEWVKGHGVTADKGIHELRKWAGSFWTNEFSPWVAKSKLRHSNVETTEKYYASATMPEVLRGLWRNPLGLLKKKPNPARVGPE